MQIAGNQIIYYSIKYQGVDGRGIEIIGFLVSFFNV